MTNELNNEKREYIMNKTDEMIQYIVQHGTILEIKNIVERIQETANTIWNREES